MRDGYDSMRKIVYSTLTRVSTFSAYLGRATPSSWAKAFDRKSGRLSTHSKDRVVLITKFFIFV